jgi:ubiquinone/menaquinone biosynthesis C-methylase UbiE
LTTDPGSSGFDREKVERLDHRASMLAPVTRLILQQAGIEPGMRVLDLGTGTGAVAHLAAELVGPTGRVVGLDRAPNALAAAEQRRRADGLTNVSFVQGDVDSWRHDSEFDAVIARLILFHLRDPAAALAHHARSLRPGARVIAMDLDASAARSVPATPSVAEAVDWILRGFQEIGANPTMGARLGSLLEAAGLRDPAVLGFTTYHPSRDANGPLLLAGIVRSLLPAIERHGTTVAGIDADSLPRRIAEELATANAVLVPPTLVAAWATVGERSLPHEGPTTERMHTFDATQCWCHSLRGDPADPTHPSRWLVAS